MDDRQYLSEAVTLAQESVENGGGPFGSLIVRDGEIIGRGCNCVTGDNDPTAHAEIVAIRAACQTIEHFSLKGSTIYASCEPCPMCLAAAYWARVDRIVYAASAEQIAAAGFDDVVIEQEMALPVAQRSIPMERITLESVEKLFSMWDQKEDKIHY
ncbi:MAG: nucleoside deaminase [Gammaproteobacteria bacterium]|nr:nucleoside deaminase [Gammaproteobacteria bacterium]